MVKQATYPFRFFRLELTKQFILPNKNRSITSVAAEISFQTASGVVGCISRK
jgi:hypothetical protein